MNILYLGVLPMRAIRPATEVWRLTLGGQGALCCETLFRICLGGRVSARPVKILVLTTTLPSAEGDATPSFVLDLAQEMAAQMPADITIVAPAAPGVPLRQRFGRVEVRRFRYLPGRWASLGASTAIVPALREHPTRLLQVPFLLVGLASAALAQARRLRPHLVHSHWVVPVGLVGQAVARSVGAVHLVTAHGSDVLALRGPVWDALRRHVVGSADLVLPVTAELAANLGLSEATVVPMGVNSRFSPLVPPGLRAANAPALFVGRLADNKGVDVLLRALAELPYARLVVAGDGPERSSLEQLAGKLSVSERVEFKGACSTDEIVDLMGCCRALVAPSTVSRDGPGAGTTVLLEAVLSGLPLIVTRTGAAGDLFTDGVDARLIDPGDVDQLASALAQSYSDPHLYEGFAGAAKASVAGWASMRSTALQYSQFLPDLSPRRE